jgi:hypothetical protein
MSDRQSKAEVLPLHQASQLEHPFATNLTFLSAEQAATARVRRFARFGYA